jgi:hypothetical protein
MFCKQSKEAVIALRDAAAPDQSPMKRGMALAEITVAAMNGCKDQELIDATLSGLRADVIDDRERRKTETITLNTTHGPFPYTRTATPPPHLVNGAIDAAFALGSQTESLNNELKRLAADSSPQHAATTTNAKWTLNQRRQGWEK